jgi:hypothetical protein
MTDVRQLQSDNQTLKRILSDIAAIRALSQQHLDRQSYFHLGPCGGCGAPSFQQPCALCGFYPMGETVVEPESPRFTCDQFEKTVRQSGYVRGEGNLATWHARAFEKTVAFREQTTYANMVGRFVAAAQCQKMAATPAEIYQAVAIERRTLVPSLTPAPAPDPIIAPIAKIKIVPIDQPNAPGRWLKLAAPIKRERHWRWAQTVEAVTHFIPPGHFVVQFSSPGDAID